MVVERPPVKEDRAEVARTESARERRPEPVANVVERQIGGKTFKLGKSLDQAEQDQVAGVIARHLDAFAWSASDMPGIDPNFLCHRLTMDPKVKLVRQRRRKFNEDTMHHSPCCNYQNYNRVIVMWYDILAINLGEDEVDIGSLICCISTAITSRAYFFRWEAVHPPPENPPQMVLISP